MKILETNRLILRNVVPDDAETMYDYRNHEICAQFQRGQTKDLNGIKELINTHKIDEINLTHPFLMAIELKKSNEMIGEIVVMPNEMTFSIGYTVSYKYHRLGFAYEALTVLINHLHDNYPTWEFISFTDPENVASIQLLEKLAYQNIGYISSINSQVFGKWNNKSTLEELSSHK